MIFQLDDTVVFEAFYTASGVGKTGLTVVVDIYRNGVSLATTQPATESGGGLYRFSYSSTGTVGRYTAVFKTSDNTVDTKQIKDMVWVGSAWTEKIDAAITTRAEFTDSSLPAVPLNYNLNLATGVNYASGNALFTGIKFQVSFDLTTAAVINLNILGPGTPDTFSGTAVDFDEATVDVDSTDTADFGTDALNYELVAVLTTGQIVKIAYGLIRMV